MFKLLLVAGAGAIIAGGMYLKNPYTAPNVYAMPLAAVYAKLSGAMLTSEYGSGPFGSLDTSVSGNGTDKIYWSASGAHASRRCAIALSPAEATKTSILVDCGGGGAGDGAAAGLAVAYTRKKVIEQVDATLEGRAYDPALARGATATGWPGNGTPGAGYGKMVVDAHKMSFEIKREQARMEREGR